MDTLGARWAALASILSPQGSMNETGFAIGQVRGGSSRRGAVRGAIPQEVRKVVWRRDDARCVRCGSQERLDLDYIVPVAQGGVTTAENVRILCQSCERGKLPSMEMLSEL